MWQKSNAYGHAGEEVKCITEYTHQTLELGFTDFDCDMIDVWKSLTAQRHKVDKMEKHKPKDQYIGGKKGSELLLQDTMH